MKQKISKITIHLQLNNYFSLFKICLQLKILYYMITTFKILTLLSPHPFCLFLPTLKLDYPVFFQLCSQIFCIHLTFILYSDYNISKCLKQAKIINIDYEVPTSAKLCVFCRGGLFR